MKPFSDRMIALFIIYLQLAMLMLVMNNDIHRLVMVVCAIVFFIIRNIELDISPKWLLYIATGFIFFFYVRYSMLPVEPTEYSGHTSPVVVVFVEYSIFVQVLLLLWRRSLGVSVVFPLGCCVSLTMLGATRFSDEGYLIYQGSILLFLCLCTWFFSVRRNRQAQDKVDRRLWGFNFAFFGIVFASTLYISHLLNVHQDELEEVFNRMTPSFSPVSGVRLNPSSELGSVAKSKDDGGETVALRIYSDGSPGYLRGFVFDQYEAPYWRSSTSMSFLEGRTLPRDKRINRFELPMLSEDVEFTKELSVKEIWPHNDIGANMFSQLHMPIIEAETRIMYADQMGGVMADSIMAGSPYKIYLNKGVGVPEPSAENEYLMLAVPDTLDPRIHELAQTVFEGAVSNEEKIHRVVKYFLDNYQYEIGITIPKDVDPLTYFLLEQPPGHCEYFASGAAILLRIGGVPCRYVTGYVSHEKNSVSDYYVARSRDAHAWVEAWTESEGWMTVEATPADGVPQEKTASRFSDWIDSLKQQIQKFKEAVVSQRWMRYFKDTFFSLRSALISVLKSPEFIVVACILLGYWYWRRKRLQAQLGAVLEYEHQACHALLDEMDNMVSEFGFIRESEETILHFARRINAEGLTIMDPIQEWYREYSTIRYNPTPDENNLLQQLNNSLANIRAQDYSSMRSKTM